MLYSYVGPSSLKVNVTKIIKNLTVDLHWDAVEDILNATYVVTCTHDGNNFENFTLKEQTSLTITGFIPDKEYTITACATNKCGNGPEYVSTVSFPGGTYH